MKNSIQVKWESDMKFVARADGHNVVLDAGESVGGKDAGPRPKTMLMVGLAGCTGMDVISILRKMKVEVESFNLHIEGDINEDHPKKFLKMKIIYEFKGKNLEMEKLEKAVNLSVDKYCGVYANFRDAMIMEHEILIHK